MRYESDQATQRGLRQQTELQRPRPPREVGGLAELLLLLLGGGLWQGRRRAALAGQHAALEQTIRALRAATRCKDRLYAIVAHDLRGPNLHHHQLQCHR